MIVHDILALFFWQQSVWFDDAGWVLVMKEEVDRKAGRIIKRET